MKKILVTGANGQLGKCLRDAEAAYPNFKMTFVSREALDINHFEEVRFQNAAKRCFGALKRRYQWQTPKFHPLFSSKHNFS